MNKDQDKQTSISIFFDKDKLFGRQKVDSIHRSDKFNLQACFCDFVFKIRLIRLDFLPKKN